MTRQKSFKLRIRERMKKTDERYSVARAALLARANRSHRRAWASDPETSDGAVRRATGRAWDDWCDLIDAWPGHDRGHTAIAAHLRAEHGLSGWWSQTVAGGYERITGRRLPYERPDGTFTAGKSRTVAVDEDELRRLLVDEAHHADLFPGHTTTRASRPGSRAIRIRIGPGTAVISLTTKSAGRVKVAIEHTGLPTFAAVEEWRFYWSEWLEAVDNSRV